MKYYLIEGMTRIVKCETTKELLYDDEWIPYLQKIPVKLFVHQDLEQELTKAGYKDGDEVPQSLFIASAVPVSMEDKFTS